MREKIFKVKGMSEISKTFVIMLILKIVWLSGCTEKEPGYTDVDSLIKVGDAAPDFSLERATGGQISLSHYRDENNVVLVFHRGTT